MIPNRQREERTHQIANLLLANRRGTEDWGDVSSKKGANRFLICCLLDYQMDSNRVWQNGYRLVREILGDPDDLWQAIASVSESDWRSKRDQYRLHRFPAAHNRLWAIATRIREFYSSDARNIWSGQSSAEVLERLLAIGAGEQISRMIVGALRDCAQISGSSDVKGDVYVRRVLGRAFIGRITDAETAVGLARKLYSRDPWQLDWPIWSLGKSCCHANQPACAQCYLVNDCEYAMHGPGSEMSPPQGIAPAVGVSYEEARGRFATALSVTTYDSTRPRLLYFETAKGVYDKVPFAAYERWIEKIPKTGTYPEWRLKDMDENERSE